MKRRGRLVATAAVGATLALGAGGGAALGHPPEGAAPAGGGPVFAAGHAGAATPGFPHAAPRSGAGTGPCTDEARGSMPIGAGHDHTDIDQHRFSCRYRLAAFLPLVKQLSGAGSDAASDEVLGEMDVKRDIAAVAVAYPQAGILFFDVSDPARPRFLSRYRGSECEGILIDVDCGAFVDMSPDGRTAYLSVQQISVVPGRPPDPFAPRPAEPGVEVIDISDRSNPRLVDVYPVVSVGGVHTSRSHIIPKGFARDAVPGEYVFSVANSFGVEITRAERTPAGTKKLVPVRRIEIDEVHDMFVANDPISKRVFMYIAAGFDTGFLVYDVTNPAEPVLRAEWDPTPECEKDWYSHTIDVTYRGGRRYVTMPAELFSFGEQSAEDQAEGCGKVVGNGDKPGPMWIVDATNLRALGPADAEDNASQEAATDARLKTASAAALVTTWTNAANRPGGNLTFSPHNQQIVGNRIFLSAYHSGVWALDASVAFGGKVRGPRARPAEIGFAVPSGEPTRPIYNQAVDPLLIPFFSEFINYRPTVWDQFWYRGYVLAADMTGGFYSYQFAGDVARIELSVSPRRARAGRRTTFAFRTTAVLGGRRVAVRGARVAFAGRAVTTDRRGRASMRATLRRATVARATKSGFLPARRRVGVTQVAPRFTG